VSGITAQRQPLLWGAIVLALVLVLVQRAPGLSTLLLGAFILAYVCAPLVDRLSKRLPRTLAIVLVMAGLWVVGLGIVLMLVPVLISQWGRLASHFPQALDFVGRVVPTLETRLGIDLPDTSGDLAAKLRDVLSTSGSHIATAGGRLTGRMFGGVAGVLGAVINFTVLVPMLAFYVLLVYHDVWPNVLGLVPPRSQVRVTAMKTEIDAALGGFVRGQLTVALILGTLFAIGYSIVGIDGAIVIGLLSGLLNMVPMVGAIIGHSLALLIAALQFGGWGPIVGVVIVIAVNGLLEQMVITPRIIGGNVGLPPLAVMLAVLGAGELFGFVGMLLAVPAAAVIKVLLMHLRRSYVESAGYRGTAEVPLATVPAVALAPAVAPAPRTDGPPPKAGRPPT
jgi:predicted PurR-regulated permease PerM